MGFDEGVAATDRPLMRVKRADDYIDYEFTNDVHSKLGHISRTYSDTWGAQDKETSTQK